MIFTVDASVAIKWFVRENFNLEADRLLDEQHLLIAPDFIFVEVANILWKKRRKGEYLQYDDQESLELLGKSVKTTFLSSVFAGCALIIAKELDHAVYDCFYLTVAQDRNAILITADHALYAKVKSSPYSHLIHWIADPLPAS